ncbi:MAG: amidohydrolase family protein, partial [Proteobacteria bacterium]|nr:amidohydrolase family protein [Pseudomonadota bacterium]
MTHDRLISLAIYVAVAMLAGCQPQDSVPTSTLIINAMIIDGTGSPGFDGALRYDGDRIVEIGDLTQIPGETIFDASGLVLAPGFIDTHSHHDRDYLKYPHMPAVLSQGVTTIVHGADGGRSIGSASNYSSQTEFNQAFLNHPVAVNAAVLSGHGSIRSAVMGDDYRREATAAEIEAMKVLVDADMRAGAIGLGTGLEYEPGIYASTEEIIELAKVAARYGGGYSSHLRDEDDRFMDALEEIIRVGREAKLRVHVAHIKLADNTFWGTGDDVIELLDSARADGVEISADIYPYLRWQSNLAVLFPDRDYTNRDTAVFT